MSALTRWEIGIVLVYVAHMRAATQPARPVIKGIKYSILSMCILFQSSKSKAGTYPCLAQEVGSALSGCISKLCSTWMPRGIPRIWQITANQRSQKGVIKWSQIADLAATLVMTANELRRLSFLARQTVDPMRL